MSSSRLWIGCRCLLGASTTLEPGPKLGVRSRDTLLIRLLLDRRQAFAARRFFRKRRARSVLRARSTEPLTEDCNGQGNENSPRSLVLARSGRCCQGGVVSI